MLSVGVNGQRQPDVADLLRAAFSDVADGRPVVLVSFYHCDKHHDQEQLGEERVYSSLQLVYHEGKSLQ